MIYIAAPKHNGLRPFIKRYGLKKNAAFKYFDVFEGGNVYAFALGEDPLSAAVFMTMACERLKPVPVPGDILLSVCPGTGSNPLVVNKIHLPHFNRSYYPEQFFFHKFDEGQASNDAGLFAAVYESAKFYFDSAVMIFMETPVDGEIEAICLWIEAVAEAYAIPGDVFTQYQQSLLYEAMARLGLSAYTQVEFLRLMRYAVLKGLDLEQILADCFWMDAKDIKGRLLLDELTERIIP